MNRYKFYIIISFSLLFQSVITAKNEWQLIGLENLRIEYVFVKGDTIWTTTRDSLYNHETYYSYNGGETWLKFELNNSEFGGGYTLKTIDPRNTQKMYITDWYGRPWKTKDGGKSWEYLMPEAEPWPEDSWRPRVKKIYISLHNEDVLFSIITENGQVDNLYRTTNDGKDWINVSAFAASSHGVELSFAFDPIDSLRLYAAGDTEFDQTFYASYDFGDSWNVLSSNVSTKWIIVDWKNNNRIYLFTFPMRSEDGGYNWTYITNGLPFLSKISSIIDPINSSTLYISTNAGIYRTTDFGEQWILMQGSESLDLGYSPGDYPEHLFIDSTTQKLYVGTKRGVYVYDLLTSIDVKSEGIPTDFILHQNYPNPFNPSTRIKYEIPKGIKDETQEVSLIVYDVLGREVAALVNEQQKPGFYDVNFNANGLTSGVYYYRLVVGLYVESRKMILLR